MSNPYAPMTRFIGPATAVTDLRYVVFMTITFVGAFMVAPTLMVWPLSEAGRIAFYESTNAFGTLAQFAVFAIPALIFVWALHRVHGRGFWSLIGPHQTAWVDLRKVVMAIAMVLVVMQFMTPWGYMTDIIEIRSPIGWVLLLPFALAVLLIQVTTEEMFFRGYLQQQLACLTPNPWVWMALPSLLFGFWHYWNGNSVPEGIAYAFWATLLGLVCADLTARTGSLGAAIGLHLTVNFFAIMFVAAQGLPFSGLALVLYAYQDPDELSAAIADVAAIWVIFNFLFSSLSVLIMWLAARIALRR